MNTHHRTLQPAALAGTLAVLAAALLLLGLAAGSEGWSFAWRSEWDLVSAIRAPRTVGALLTGALLGLAGAMAQGLFRNPLADPYLLGAAAGAGLGVVLVLAAGGVMVGAAGLAGAAWLYSRWAWWARPLAVHWPACCSRSRWRAALRAPWCCCWPAWW